MIAKILPSKIVVATFAQFSRIRNPAKIKALKYTLKHLFQFQSRKTRMILKLIEEIA